MLRSLVGSEMCIRDRVSTQSTGLQHLTMAYPLGSYCYSGTTYTSVSPRAVEETAPEWWNAVQHQDQRRHDWIMQREAEAQRAIERQILARNQKLLPGDYAMCRLGETAHVKGLVANSVSAEARQQEVERVAESHRTPRERAMNWNQYSRMDRHDWAGQHARRTQAAIGVNVGLHHNQMDPQYSAAWDTGRYIADHESSRQARIQASSQQHSLNVFTNHHCRGERPHGFHAHVKKPYR
eukprot:TRINITY_DN9356_c0_g1_i1.p1 TRINITY_DN9356_c0_g1~~TRINITY_DN9356_c0_g1_i1.p1  ORF type:complete len:238 (-),score=53.65 TRINITY_DN9356_c0_g1_i1:536-1249(-)